MSRYADNNKSLVLISDGYTDGLDFNSQSQFINKFPIDLDCQTSEFEMALTKIKFPNSIYNLPNGEIHNMRIIHTDTSEIIVELSAGYYSLEGVLSHISSKLNVLSLNLNPTSMKVVITSNRDVKCLKINFSKTLGELLGFESDSDLEMGDEGEMVASDIHNMNPNDQLYVYCSMIGAEHVVGGALTNLLCVCPISTRTFNECVVYEPKHLTFLPVKRQHFLYCTIYIYDHSGKRQSFEQGSVEVYVRLRRVSPFL